MTPKYAKVVIPGLAIDTAFDYELDTEQQQQVTVGQQVYVPFGRKNVHGIVVAATDKSEIKNLKKVIRLETSLPLISPELLDLTRRVADYYYASWGEVLQGCIVQKKTQKKEVTESKKNVCGELPGLLTEKQSYILQSLQDFILNKNIRPVLLWGATLEVRLRLYLNLIENNCHTLRQVLVLFPEIELLEQYAALFTQRYGEEAGIVHSGLSAAQRYECWNQIYNNTKKIILATRVALFCSFPQLSLIIVEQEHDPVYKSDQKPLYHARDVALMWQNILKIPLILGSDIPSVESFYQAQQKKYDVLAIEPETEKSFPAIQVLKMSEKDTKKEHLLITSTVREEINKRLRRGEKVLVFANMRGYASFVYCRMCGKIRQCPHCELALSLSKETNKLYCKYCQFQTKFKEECPYCDSRHFKSFGLGLEAIMEKLKRLFPQARIARMDAHTFDLHLDVSRYDIIVGTQVLNKLSAYPQVTLLCVLLIDVFLNLPDFRSGERVFQNVYGLAQKLDYTRQNATVFVQSCNDTHYVLQALRENKPEIFYQQDLLFREELGYPPFGAMIEILVSSKDKEKAEKVAHDISGSFQEEKVTVLGPVPAYRAKLRGYYRQHIFLLAKDRKILRKLLHSRLSPKRDSASKLKIVVDPVELS